MSTNKTIALITGVSREEGIGFGVAREMSKRGFEVLITARDLKKAEELAKRISGKDNVVTAEQLDITNNESVRNISEFIKARFGRLDVLINNAAAPLDYMVEPLDTDFEVVTQAFETNLFGTWRMIKSMHPLLRMSKHARIVNISSGAGSFTDPEFGLGVHPALLTAYGISKLALNGLTVKLARQLKSDNILINAIDPGLTATAPGMENMGARPVGESVEGILWAAALPENGPTGKFFRDKKPFGW